jgi:hypothetical protein
MQWQRLSRTLMSPTKHHEARSLLKSLASFWPAHTFDLIPEAMTAAKESVPKIADGVRRGDVEAAITGYRELFEKYAMCVTRQVAEDGAMALGRKAE